MMGYRFMFPGMMFFMVLGLAVFSAGVVFIKRFLKGPPSSVKKSGETARNSIQREIFKLARSEGGSDIRCIRMGPNTNCKFQYYNN